MRTVVATCPACDGKKLVDGRMCPTCDGDGVKWRDIEESAADQGEHLDLTYVPSDD